MKWDVHILERSAPSRISELSAEGACHAEVPPSATSIAVK
jgi:hypothetical protein